MPLCPQGVRSVATEEVALHDDTNGSHRRPTDRSTFGTRSCSAADCCCAKSSLHSPEGSTCSSTWPDRRSSCTFACPRPTTAQLVARVPGGAPAGARSTAGSAPFMRHADTMLGWATATGGQRRCSRLPRAPPWSKRRSRAKSRPWRRNSACPRVRARARGCSAGRRCESRARVGLRAQAFQSRCQAGFAHRNEVHR